MSCRVPSGSSKLPAAVGFQNLKLDPEAQTAMLLRPQMVLDLGGIAMGYTVDEVLAVLAKQGIRRALVDASGDIGVGDPPPGKAGWRVGIAPLRTDAAPSRYVELANRAISTSGDAFQHVDIGGKRYSHIVDPRTGLGLTDSSSVTVIADHCFTSDGLDTTVSVLGPEKGLALVAKTGGAASLDPADGRRQVGDLRIAGLQRVRCSARRGEMSPREIRPRRSR